METQTDPIFEQVQICLEIGDKAAARHLLREYLKQHPGQVNGWLSLSRCVETRAETVFCLEQAARLQPENTELRRAIERMQPRQAAPTGVVVRSLPAQASSAQPVAPANPPSALRPAAPRPAIPPNLRALPKYPFKSVLIGTGLVALALLAVFIFYLRTRPQPALTSIAAGGVFTYQEQVRVEVPAGALADGDRVKITPSVPENWAAVPGFMRVWEIITANNVAPEKPLVITLSYAGLANAEITDPELVFVAHWNGTEWEIVDGEVDLQRQTVTVKAKSLSPFAVVVTPHLQALVDGLLQIISADCDEIEDFTRRVDAILTTYPVGLLPGSVRVCHESQDQSPQAFRDTAGNRISLNPEWLNRKIAALPEEDGELLINAILAHELSHILRANADDFDSLQKVDVITPEVIGAVEADLTTNKFIVEDAYSKKSIQRWVVAMINQLPLHQLTVEEIRAKGNELQQEHFEVFEAFRAANLDELVSDRDAARWTGATITEKQRAALLMIYSHSSAEDVHDYLHPSNALRARMVANETGLGDVGAITGQVTLGDFTLDLCGTTLTLDDQPAVETDCEGRFFLAGVSSGAHSLTIAKTGYQPTKVAVTVTKWGVLALNRYDTELVKETGAHFPLNPANPGRIAYADETNNIALYRMDTGEITRVTQNGNNQTWYSFPQFSPDGSRLAYCWNKSGMGDFALFVASSDGSNPRELVDHTACMVDWTPDGKALTVNLADTTATPAAGAPLQAGALWNVDVETGEKTLLVAPFSPNPLMLPVWSPTGDWLLLNEITYIEGSGNLTAWNAKTGAYHQSFTGDLSRAGVASFSPDGKQVAYGEAVYMPQLGFGAYIADIDGQNRRKVFVRSDGGVGLVQWSPDGQRLAIGFHTADSFMARRNLMVINVDGSGAQTILENLEGEVVWAPDGQSLLISQAGEIFVHDLVSGTNRHIAQSASYSHIDWYVPEGVSATPPVNSDEDDVQAILREVQAWMRAGSPTFLDALGADQIHHKPCCGNFALSNAAWQTRAEAVQNLSHDWVQEGTPVCKFLYTDFGGDINPSLRTLIVMVNDQLTLTFNHDSTTGSALKWTEYSTFPSSTLDFTNWKACPEE